MTAVAWTGRLLTLDEFAVLLEDNSMRYELDEGILVVSPRPGKSHQRAIARLDPPAGLTSYVLVDGHYQESPTVTGEFATVDPFPLWLDVPRARDTARCADLTKVLRR